MFYDPYAGSVFNLVFTAFPVMLAAIFNKEVSRESSLKYDTLPLLVLSLPCVLLGCTCPARRLLAWRALGASFFPSSSQDQK